jgi:uncharacterized membrane protein YfcA
VPVLAIPLGILIGLALGALGGGGSILTVPALVFAAGQDPRSATTSSLLIVGITSLIALIPHARAGRVRVGQGLAFGALGIAGSFAGSALSARVPAPVLLTAFAALLLVVSVALLRRSRRGRRAGARAVARPASAAQSVAASGAAPEAPPEAASDPTPDPTADPMFTIRPLACACPRVAKVLVTASLVGLLTGFFGVGGGFALVPALVLALGFRMPVAVGTSLLVIAVNSGTALMARIGTGTGHLDWTLIGGFTAAAVAGSLIGGRVMGRVEPRHLTRAFAVLLVLVALYTAGQSVPSLV